MTRPPSRPLLKLPTKVPATDDAPAPSANASLPKRRKPVRAGSFAPRQTAEEKRRAQEIAASRSAPPPAGKPARPISANSKPAERRMTESTAPRTPARKTPRIDAVVPSAPRASTEQQTAPRRVTPRPETAAGEAPAKKVYPPRGVARSAGARACPPPRRDADHTAIGAAARPKPLGTAHGKPHPPEAGHSPARPAASTASPGGHGAPHATHLADAPRLAKRVCDLTGCSRREADDWIENGWVSVDGAVVSTLGARVHAKARIEIAEAARDYRPEIVTILFNKPAGMVLGDVNEQPDLGQLIRAETRWAEDAVTLTFKATHRRQLAQAGRIDPEVEGLVVFTQEGSVARRLTGDATRLEKEYLVRIDGTLSDDGLRRLNGVQTLDDIKLKRAQVSWQNERQLRVVLHEQRPHQIQRMFELVGVQVIEIRRLRIGSVPLGKLPAGQWRYLREGERF